MFQLLNEIGDAGDSRGTSANVTSSIGASPVVADAERSGMLAASRTRVCELDEGAVEPVYSLIPVSAEFPTASGGLGHE